MDNTIILCLSMFVLTSCSSTGSNSNSTTSIKTGSESTRTGMNLSGCPRLQKDCSFDCLSIVSDGCIVCTCTASGGDIQTSGSGSAGNGSVYTNSSNNNNGCPAFPLNCDPKCAQSDSTGCPICACIKAGSSSNTHHFMTSGASANANGCPVFLPTCRQECTALDGNGCPICFCDHSKGSTGIGTNHTSGYISSHTSMPGPVGNNNGCPTFPTSCRRDCVSLRNDGCPLCLCKGGETTSTTTQIPSVSGSGGSTVMCPAFDGIQCDPSCFRLNAKGCLTCSCGANTTSTQPSVIKQTSTADPSQKTPHAPSANQTVAGTTGNANSCPHFDVNCKPGCAVLDAHGCLSCSCGPDTSAYGLNKTTGNGSGCPPFDSSCSQTCTHINSMGCLTCKCQGSTLQGNSNGCPPFDLTCPSGCASIDSIGCLTCACSGSTVVPEVSISREHSSGSNCPYVDIFKCQPYCLKVDSNGCLFCECKASNSSDTGTIKSDTVTLTPVAMSTTVATRASSRSEMAVPTRPTTQISPVTAKCRKFDVSCSSACTRLDQRGCLICSCAASSTISTKNPTTMVNILTNYGATTLKKLQQTVCRPIRCVYPCDDGISLAADNCPVCRCRVTTSKP